MMKIMSNEAVRSRVKWFIFIAAAYSGSVIEFLDIGVFDWRGWLLASAFMSMFVAGWIEGVRNILEDN